MLKQNALQSGGHVPTGRSTLVTLLSFILSLILVNKVYNELEELWKFKYTTKGLFLKFETEFKGNDFQPL